MLFVAAEKSGYNVLARASLKKASTLVTDAGITQNIFESKFVEFIKQLFIAVNPFVFKNIPGIFGQSKMKFLATA